MRPRRHALNVFGKRPLIRAYKARRHLVRRPSNIWWRWGRGLRTFCNECMHRARGNALRLQDLASRHRIGGNSMLHRRMSCRKDQRHRCRSRCRTSANCTSSIPNTQSARLGIHSRSLPFSIYIRRTLRNCFLHCWKLNCCSKTSYSMNCSTMIRRSMTTCCSLTMNCSMMMMNCSSNCCQVRLR